MQSATPSAHLCVRFGNRHAPGRPIQHLLAWRVQLSGVGGNTKQGDTALLLSMHLGLLKLLMASPHLHKLLAKDGLQGAQLVRLLLRICMASAGGSRCSSGMRFVG